MPGVNPYHQPYLNKAISILRRKEHSEVQAALSIQRIEVLAERVHEDTRAFAPHLTALRNVHERYAEDQKSLRGAVKPMSEPRV